MSSSISNKDLMSKCGEFIKADNTGQSLDKNIQNALITSCREIANLGGYQPLAWLRQSYDELFTKVYASISAITQADPGVVTAESQDTDIDSDTGFVDDDIGFIRGIAGMTRLNERYFTLTRASAPTLTLAQLDAQNDINTTATTGPEVYQEYDSGGHVYHAGIKLPASTIEPTSSTAAPYRWKIKRVWNVMFDGYPSYPISEEESRSDKRWNSPGGRPERWRYFRRSWADPRTYDHFVMFHPPPSNMHNITVNIEKSFPDLSSWQKTAFNPHPPEVHDFIWHRALANMVTLAERQRRELTGSERPMMMGKIEILYAQVWQQKKLEDELAIKALSKQMLGEQPSTRGLSA